jgi:hypothetical protein
MDNAEPFVHRHAANVSVRSERLSSWTTVCIRR